MLLPYFFAIFQFHTLFQVGFIARFSSSSTIETWVLVFDCGNNKTKVSSYKFESDVINTYSPVYRRTVLLVNNVTTAKWERGLGEIDPRNAANQRLIKENVAAILNKAVSGIVPSPNSQGTSVYIYGIHSAEVYIYATAGLRTLPKTRADALLRLVEDGVRSANFKVVSNNSKVITGRAEAAYAWLAVNHFTALQTRYLDFIASVVDLGGSSMQIGFKPITDCYSWERTNFGPFVTIPLRLPPMSPRCLGVANFDNYGDRMLTVKIAGAEGCNEPNKCSGKVFYSPCLHERYLTTFTHGTYQFTLKGSPEVTSENRYRACRDRVQKIMLQEYFKKRGFYVWELTSRNGEAAPVVGVSAVYYIANYTNEVHPLASAGSFCSGYKMQIRDFKAGAEKLCEKPDNSTDPYKPFACTLAMYMWMILTDGTFGFRWVPSQRFYACKTFTHTIGKDKTKKFKASWSLGVAVQSKTNILSLNNSSHVDISLVDA